MVVERYPATSLGGNVICEHGRQRVRNRTHKAGLLPYWASRDYRLPQCCYCSADIEEIGRNRIAISVCLGQEVEGVDMVTEGLLDQG